jgi:hypothetical protein
MTATVRCASCGRFTPEPYLPARLLAELVDAVERVNVVGEQRPVVAYLGALDEAKVALRVVRS